MIIRLGDQSQTYNASLIGVVRDVLKLEDSLPSWDGRLRPTIPFLREIVAMMHRRGVEIDVSQAWQVWNFVHAAVTVFSEEFEIDSEIAWLYGVDSSDWDETRKLGFDRNIARNHARSRLRDGDYSPTDYEGVYQLTLLATGDEELAQRRKTKAFEKYAEQQSKRGNA